MASSTLMSLTIFPYEGNGFAEMPRERNYQFQFVGVWPAASVTVNGIAIPYRPYSTLSKVRPSKVLCSLTDADWLLCVGFVDIRWQQPFCTGKLGLQVLDLPAPRCECTVEPSPIKHAGLRFHAQGLRCANG